MLFLATPLILVLVTDKPGLRARGSEQAYPAHAQEAVVSIGAEMLSAEEVRNTFATDLNRGFLVVEVGVFPSKDKSWNLNAADFSLRIGSEKMVRPASPSTISAILQRKANHQGGSQRAGSPNDIVVYPSATIGYESGSGGIDSSGRQRRGGGWVTGGGVGVGTAGNTGGPMPPPPASTGADRAVMQEELRDKSLPEGEIKTAVAGYLYFPMPADQKKSPAGRKAFELVYQNVDAKIRVNVPRPK